MTALTTTLNRVNTAIQKMGGEIYVVGGPIRDLIMGNKLKDVDLLVRNLDLPEIQEAISSIGSAKEVSKSFGIVKGVVDNLELDFAIPRICETRTGDTHTSFEVQTDPFAPVTSDLGRRDFTMNAMALPLNVFIYVIMRPNALGMALNSHLIDPFNGRGAIDQKLIETPGEAYSIFDDDKLRMLRALQFASRFDLEIEQTTKQVIVDMASKLHPSANFVTGERIWMEFEKAWSRSRTHTLAHLLDQLGVGNVLFGEEFNPHPIVLPISDPSSNVKQNFVAYFLAGGDFSIMKPPNEHQTILSMAQSIQGDELPYTYMTPEKKSAHLKLVQSAFSHMSKKDTAQKCNEMLAKAITPKELFVDGTQLANILNIVEPKDRKKIGQAQKLALEAIWRGEIENDIEQIVNYVGNMLL